MDLYTAVLIVHILGVAIGAGGALTTDLLFFSASRDKKISDDEIRLIRTGSLATWIGVYILIVSGFTLLYLGNFALMAEPRFQAKLTLVIILVLNGAIFHFIHLPFIANTLSYAKRLPFTVKQRLCLLIASGAISVTTWISIIIFAYAKEATFSYMTWMGLYLIALVVMLFFAFVVGVYHFPSLSIRISKTMYWRAGISALVLFLALVSYSLSVRIHTGEIIRDNTNSYTAITPKNELPVDSNSDRSDESQAHSSDNEVGADEDSDVKEFTLTAGNYYYSEEEIRVEKGDTVRIILESEGGLHNWVLDEFNVESERVSSGKRDVIEFTADEVGEFVYYCSVGQHRQLGQVGTLIVEEQ